MIVIKPRPFEEDHTFSVSVIDYFYCYTKVNNYTQ